MARGGKTYELAVKIAGKVDASLKRSCIEADKQLSSLATSAEKIGSVAKTAAATAAAAIGTIAVASTAAYMEHEAAANSLAATTGAAGKELENLQDAANAAYMNGYGESIQGVADTVSLVDRNMKRISPDEIQAATEAAITLNDAFGYAAEESTRAANAIQQNFGGSAEQAFSLIAAGAQNGLDYSGELIDTVSEYSSQFSKLGFTADGMFNLLQSGADSTAWNLDKVGDAIKEFSIRAIDGSSGTVEAFTNLGYNAEEMMATFAAGGTGANQAFFDVLGTLMAVDDQVQRDAMGVALFGTMWEDLGAEAMQAMANASTAVYDTTGALEQMKAALYDGLGPAFERVKRQAELLLVNIGTQMAPYIEQGLGYLSTTVLPAIESGIEAILPKIVAIATALWENRDVILAVAAAAATGVVAFKAMGIASTAISAVKNLAPIFAAAVKSGGVLKTVMTLLGGKFAIIAAVVAAVAGAFVILWNRSETFRTAVLNLWAQIQPLLAAIQNLASTLIGVLGPILSTVANLIISVLGAAFVQIAPYIGNVISILTNLVEFVTNVFSGNWSAAWQNVVNIFGTVFGGIIDKAKSVVNSAISIVNSAISAINGVSGTVPEWVPGIGGKTIGFNIPTIPMLAEGGIATGPTLAEIGEGGEPEAVMPLSKLAAMLDNWTKTPEPGGPDPERGDPIAIPWDGPKQGDVIHFSPVFNFYGGNPTKEEAVQAAQLSFAEFKRFYKQMKAEERRKSFVPT